MSWILLSILAGLFWAVCNLADKLIMERWKITPDILFTLISTTFFLSGVAVWAYIGFPILPLGHALLAGLAGVTYFLCFVFYYRALAIEEVSRVVPLWYIAPLFLLFFAAIFLGERLGGWQIVGVALLVLGAFAITSRTFWIRPRWRVLLLMIGADLFFTASALIGKYLLSSMDVWTLYAYTRLAGIVVIVPALFLFWNVLTTSVKINGPAFLGILFIEELFNAAGDIMWLFAIALGSVTLATALSSLQPFFVFLFCLVIGLVAPRFLNEDRRDFALAFKLVSIAVMFAGVVLVM